ncbi:MAG: hypothetical protein Q7R72_02215 [bacterium]|nr:hypothetical protein [bacterium]
MTLTQKIMKKVRTIFILRRLALPSAVFVMSVAIIVSTVSVSNVIANMPDLFNIQAVIRFFVTAFAHTDIVIKSALVAGLVFLALTLKGAMESKRLSMRLERA